VTDELVIQHSLLRSRPKVFRSDIASLKNWLDYRGNAILDEETRFLDHREDLVALAPKEKVPLRALLERSDAFRKSWLFRRSSTINKDADQRTFYISDERMNRFISFIIVIIGLLMLITPLWVLAFVPQTIYRLTVITVFTVIFMSLVSFAVDTEPVDGLVATAG
jgi:hypothetical protein